MKRNGLRKFVEILLRCTVLSDVCYGCPRPKYVDAMSNGASKLGSLNYLDAGY